MPKQPTSLRPMIEFDPAEPAILHDTQTDRIITWIGDEAPSYRQGANLRSDGSVEWNGYILDGWDIVLGG